MKSSHAIFSALVRIFAAFLALAIVCPAQSPTDLDGDGILNVHDGDIDGDGAHNAVDFDDDGDGVNETMNLPATGRVAHWAAEGNAGDFFGTSHGTTNGNLVFAPGRIGQAFSSTGNGGHVSVADSAALDLVDNFTIGVWIFPTQFADGMIFHKELAYECERTGNGSIRFAWGNTTPGWQWTTAAGPGSAPLNTWTHIAFTYSGGVTKAYINGALVKTHTGAGSVAATEHPLLLGSRLFFPNLSFSGSIDSMMIYDRVLEPSEIAGFGRLDATPGGAGTMEDFDGDGVPNALDADLNGNGILNVFDPDPDGDALANANDTNDDNDGIADWGDVSRTGLGSDADFDGDGVLNALDNDLNGNGIANLFDLDVDGDGVPNDADSDDNNNGVPDSAEPPSRVKLSDFDGDGILNATDTDIDGDGIINALDADTDGDGLPNDGDPDNDSDGLPDGFDVSPTGRGTGADLDGDKLSNELDPDMDGDGVLNILDADTDGDGIANGEDPDDDNDITADASAIPEDGKLAHWAAEGNGDDSATGRYSGVASPGLTFAPGHTGMAFYSNGRGSRFVVDSAVGLNVPDAFTIAAWIYPMGASFDPVIVHKNHCYEIARFNDGRLGFAWKNTSPGWDWTTVGEQGTAPLLRWTHIALSYEAGVTRVYVNGVLIHTQNGSGAVAGSTEALHIGGRNFIQDASFNGCIDDVLIYGRALTPLEVAVLGGSPDDTKTGLGSLSDFDGDGSGNHHDPDIDGDGVLNEADYDSDGDGVANAEDSDDDNDGTDDDDDATAAGAALNEPPNDIILTPARIAENQPAGTLVGLLSAVDVNAEQVHTFTLVAGPGGRNNGDFTIVGNELHSETAFNFEVEPSLSVRVRVDDDGLPSRSLEKVIPISVQDVFAVQQIIFPPLPDRTVVDPPFVLDATGGNSGRPVVFSVRSGPAFLVGNVLTVTGPGIVIVRAAQGGSEDYTAAAAIERSFTVLSAPGNRAPVARTDVGLFVESTATESLSVLANDSDIDGDELTVISVAQPERGTVAISPDGRGVTYTAHAMFRGTDTFSYTIADPSGATSSATATVTGPLLDPSTGVLLRAHRLPALASPVSGVQPGAYLRTVGVPAVRDDGSLVVTGTARQPDGKSVAGILRGMPDGAVEFLHRAGDDAPGIAGGRFAGFGAPFLDHQDTGPVVTFFGTVTGRGIGLSNNDGIWTNAFSAGGVLALVAREGGPAPGVSSVRFAAFSSAGIVFDQGERRLAFVARLAGPGITTANDTGLWLADGAHTRLLLRKGAKINRRTVSGFSVLSPRRMTGGHGQGFTASGDETHIGQMAVLIKFAGGEQLNGIIHEGGLDVIAETSSHEVPGAATGAKWARFTPPILSDTGLAVFVGTTKPLAGQVSTLNDIALFAETAPGLLMNVATEGGRPGGASRPIATFDGYVNDSTGAVLYCASPAGSIAGSRGPGSLYLWRDGATRRLARAGEIAAGTTAKWKSFSAFALPDGMPVFTGTLAGAGVMSGTDAGLWFAARNGILHLALREGQPLDGRAVASFTILGHTPGSGSQKRSFNGNRVFLAQTVFTDGGMGIVRIKVP